MLHIWVKKKQIYFKRKNRNRNAIHQMDIVWLNGMKKKMEWKKRSEDRDTLTERN